MGQLSNFRFIERNVDVKNIVQQVLDNPDDWGVAGSIKGAAGDLQPYGFLPLMMAVVNDTDVVVLVILKILQLQQDSTMVK